jgi:uncharacterized protein
MRKLAALTLAIALALFLGLARADAASFDCTRAAAAVERMICADEAISKLDERLAAAYRRSLQRFDIDSDAGDALGVDLRNGHRSWLRRRDRCKDAACLKSAYAEEIAVLDFAARPGGGSWADRAAGSYDHAGFIHLLVQVRDGDSVRVVVSGAEPSAARWTCKFAGIGRRLPSGDIAVQAPAGANQPTLTLHPADAAIDIPAGDANDAVSRAACGLNGTLAWRYARQR